MNTDHNVNNGVNNTAACIANPTPPGWSLYYILAHAYVTPSIYWAHEYVTRSIYWAHVYVAASIYWAHAYVTRSIYWAHAYVAPTIY